LVEINFLKAIVVDRLHLGAELILMMRIKVVFPEPFARQ
jgi:hypothetical protein